MLEILLAITCMILIGTFWRKILPVAGIALVLFVVIGGLFLLAVNNDLTRRGVGQQVAIDPVVERCIKEAAKADDGLSRAGSVSAEINCFLANPPKN